MKAITQTFQKPKTTYAIYVNGVLVLTTECKTREEALADYNNLVVNKLLLQGKVCNIALREITDLCYTLVRK